MSKFKLNEKDRVVILRDYSFMGNSVTKGTIGTLRTFINDEVALIQTGYNSEKDEIICCGCPINVLKRATITDINKVDDYKKVIPKLYHLENKFSIYVENKTKMGIIKGITLATNEQNDNYSMLISGDENPCVFSKDYLDEFSSPIFDDIPPFDEEENRAYENEIGTNVKNFTNDNEDDDNDEPLDDPAITIDKFEFRVNGNRLLLPNSIEKEDLGAFINALRTLKQFGITV